MATMKVHSSFIKCVTKDGLQMLTCRVLSYFFSSICTFFGRMTSKYKHDLFTCCDSSFRVKAVHNLQKEKNILVTYFCPSLRILGSLFLLQRQIIKILFPSCFCKKKGWRSYSPLPEDPDFSFNHVGSMSDRPRM